jgi:hypothetical protein
MEVQLREFLILALDECGWLEAWVYPREFGRYEKETNILALLGI